MATKTPPSNSHAMSQTPTVSSAPDDAGSGAPLTPLMGPSENAEQVAHLDASTRVHRLSPLDARTRAELIKRSCRIEDVVMGQGVLLRVVGDGQHLVGLCPFHQEQRASFTVYPDTQSFCCFGCHAAGDVITFICLLRQVTFNEALRILGEQQSHLHALATPTPGREPRSQEPADLLPSTQPRVESANVPVMRHLIKQGIGSATRPEIRTDLSDCTAESQEATQEIDARTSLAQALLWITHVLGMQGLARTPGVLTYLGERGISYALACRCQLGYLADDLLATLLVGPPTLERAARQMGLLNRGGHISLLRRLIVPEMRHGQTTQLIGRTVPGMRTPIAQIKYHLVCGAGEKHLLGYGAALQRLTQHCGVQGGQNRRISRKNRQELLGILVLEGALDYVIATGWDLPVLPIALLSTYPSRKQLAELLDLQQRAGGLPLLLQLDSDGPGQEANVHLTRTLDERRIRYQVLPPLPRVPVSAPTYKDLGEIAPLGLSGHTQVLAHLEQALAPTTKTTGVSTETATTPLASHGDSASLSDMSESLKHSRQGGN